MADTLHRPDGAQLYRVTLLGGFGLSCDGDEVGVPVTIGRIVGVLALRGRSARSRVAGTVWPHSTEERALANLRTAIWRVNGLAPGLVTCSAETVALADGVVVDVAQLVAAAHDILHGRDVPTLPGPALHQVEADLLPDWDDEWLVADRERLRQLRLHVLEQLAGQLATRGMFGMALEAALAALAADPLRESAHRAVIRIHLAEGNRAEAVQAYRRCSAALAEGFGVRPDPETMRLVGGLVRHGGALPAVG